MTLSRKHASHSTSKSFSSLLDPEPVNAFSTSNVTISTGALEKRRTPFTYVSLLLLRL